MYPWHPYSMGHLRYLQSQVKCHIFLPIDQNEHVQKVQRQICSYVPFVHTLSSGDHV